MKTYADFFEIGEVSGKLVSACGDRAIIQIDSRLSHTKKMEIARETCKQRGYKGYQLLKGSSLLRSEPITDIYPVNT